MHNYTMTLPCTTATLILCKSNCLFYSSSLHDCIALSAITNLCSRWNALFWWSIRNNGRGAALVSANISFYCCWLCTVSTPFAEKGCTDFFFLYLNVKALKTSLCPLMFPTSPPPPDCCDQAENKGFVSTGYTWPDLIRPPALWIHSNCILGLLGWNNRYRAEGQVSILLLKGLHVCAFTIKQHNRSFSAPCHQHWTFYGLKQRKEFHGESGTSLYALKNSFCGKVVRARTLKLFVTDLFCLHWPVMMLSVSKQRGWLEQLPNSDCVDASRYSCLIHRATSDLNGFRFFLYQNV